MKELLQVKNSGRTTTREEKCTQIVLRVIQQGTVHTTLHQEKGIPNNLKTKTSDFVGRRG